MKRKMLPAIITIAVLFLIWITYGYLSARNIESPKYEVLSADRSFEIRNYESFIIAETTVDKKSYQKSTNQGFRIVADYIFGNNTKQDKIAMTAPVVTESSKENGENDSVSEKIAMTTPVVTETEGDGKMKLYFVMPSEFKLDELPTPNNAQVSLIQIPAETRLVLNFSGWATESKIDAKIKALKDYASEKNLEIGLVQVAQYNPPFTPPFMRRNEIWATISSNEE